MRILIVTPSDAGGHHNEYKELLSLAFTELGHKVLHFSLTNEKSVTQSKFFSTSRILSAGVSGGFSKCFYALGRILKTRRDSQQKWNTLFNHLNSLYSASEPVDLLFLECLDSFTGQFITNKFIDNNLHVPFSGILIAPRDRRLMSKKFLRLGPFDPNHILKSRKCISIAVLIKEAVPILSVLINKPVIYLPDIVTIPKTVRDESIRSKILNRANNRFIIGIWGSLEQRKGIGDFFKLCLKLSADEYFFVMGGTANTAGWESGDIEFLLQSDEGNKDNIIVFNRWLTDDELLSGMSACDLIFAAYPNWQFSSGIIGKAAVLGIPVLVNAGYVMGHLVEEFKIGFLKNQMDDVSMWIIGNKSAVKEFRTSDSFKEGCARYCESHGYEKWVESLFLILKPLSEFSHLQETKN